MRTALIITAGTRGDVEPFLALLPTLLDRFDRVHLLLQPDYTSQITHPRATAHTLPFSQQHVVNQFIIPFFKTYFLTHLLGVQAYNEAVKRDSHTLAYVISRLVVPALPHMISIATEVKPCVVLSSILTTAVAHTVAQKVNAQFIFVSFHPNVRTDMYPFQLVDLNHCLQAAQLIADLRSNGTNHVHRDRAFAKSYDEMLYTLHQPCLSLLNSTRAKYEMAPTNLVQISSVFNGDAPNCHVINSYPPQLIPPDVNWPSTIHHTLPLALNYHPPTWNASRDCPQLVEYLQQGPPPFVITFGSMVLFDNFTKVSRHLLTSLREAGLKRILFLKCSLDVGAHRLTSRDEDLKAWASKHVWICDEKVAFSWLFNHVQAVMCHGGVGTTFTALRAGKPVLVAPFCMDQFFWGALVKHVGVGGCLKESARELDVKDCVNELKKCLSEDVKNKVEMLGAELRKTDAPKEAAEIVNRIADSRQQQLQQAIDQ